MKNIKPYLLFLRGEISMLNITLLVIFLALVGIELWTADPPLWELLRLLWSV